MTQAEYYTYYPNIEMFKQQEPRLYQATIGKITIEDHACVYVYDKPELYAKYSITEGEYLVDMTTAPIDLTLFIDYEKLAKHFLQTLDKTSFYHDPNSNKLIEVLN